MSEPGSDSPRSIPAELGSFRVSGVLGEGGSAVVYAVDFEGQDAALKVPRERELTAKEQERFLEEAKMLERVQHRAVVEVLGSGRLPDGQPYLLMRRYEGETLADHLAASGPLPVRRAIDLFEQLASAVDALHLAGLLHRDLKPENVMLVGGGRDVKLLDFGIAKEIGAPASTTTQAGVARGTPATMAPERFFGAAASTSTDVYELCVVLYAMLVGRLPWSDVTNVQARLNPTSPTEACSDVPEALSAVVMQGLSTRPERRPASIASLRLAVREALDGPVLLAEGRVTAGVAVRSPSPELAALVPRASEDAQIIESQRETASRKKPLWAYVSFGAALGAALVVAVTLGQRGSAERAEGTGAADQPASAIAPGPSPAPTDSALPRQLPTASAPAALPTATASAPSGVPTSAKPAAKAPAQSRVGLGAEAGPALTTSPRSTPTAAFPTKVEPSPGAKSGKPKGAPCTRSSECASMVCAADSCQ